MLTPGTRIGAYELGAHLGSGGMGVVYRAHDRRLGRDVALKVLPAAFSAHPDRLARFDREARLLASLSHPNIAAAEMAVTRLLRFIGEEPARDGLVDTPRQVVRAWRQMTAGYREDPAVILGRTFEETQTRVCSPMLGRGGRASRPHRVAVSAARISAARDARHEAGGTPALRQSCLNVAQTLLSALSSFRRSSDEVIVLRGVSFHSTCEHHLLPFYGTASVGYLLGTLRNDPLSRSEFLRLSQTINAS